MGLVKFGITLLSAAITLSFLFFLYYIFGEFAFRLVVLPLGCLFMGYISASKD